MRSDPRGEYWLNYGAHLFPAPGSLVDAMARDVRAADRAGDRQHDGLAVGSDAAHPRPGRDLSVPAAAVAARPGRVRGRGPALQRAVAPYRRATAARPGETPADVRARVLAFEDDRTFGEFLGPLPPAVEAIFSCAAHRATAELSELSAGCGIGLFALVWGGKGSLIARNLLGGTGALPAALGDAAGRARPDRLPRHARCARRATTSSSSTTTASAIRARHVIVAVAGAVRGAARRARWPSTRRPRWSR